MSEKARKKLSERMLGDNNPSRKFGVWNKGKTGTVKHSDEHKEQMRLLFLGKPKSEEAKKNMSLAMRRKPKSEEHKRKLSLVNIGKKLSPETIEKCRMATKGKKQKILTCPYCLKSGGTTMYRWHFDNCPTRKK
jgi:hypothetical protein